MTRNPRHLVFPLILFCLALPVWARAQENKFSPSGDVHNILPLWDQAKFMARQLQWRQEHVLPEIMRRERVDLWIVERNEGVLYLSLVPGDKEGLVPEDPSYLVYHAPGSGGTVDLKFAEPDQLAGLIERLKPERIGVCERNIPRMKETLGNFIGGRLADSKNLRIGFLEKRSPEEISAFHYMTRIAHDVIAEAFSNRAIIPDVTTTDELNWWIRQRYRDLGLLTSDHPTITLQRCRAERTKYPESDEHFRIDIPPRNGFNSVIRRGDIIACDTGIDYLGLGTDTQQVAYVLEEGETAVPEGLRTAMARTSRLQDLFAAEFREGRKGNDIGLSALKKARDEGLRPAIYSHPIPYFLMRYEGNGAFYKNTRYGAGPALGSGESEKRTERGEYPVYVNTVYAMELDTMSSVPEWGGQDVRIVLEQTVAFTDKGLEFLGGRQTDWYVIK
jgi:hypothetical protein